MPTYLLAFLAAAAASMALTRVVRDAAATRGLFDAPNAARKWHAAPTPRLGGVAIYGAIWIAIGCAAGVPSLPGYSVPAQAQDVVSILLLGGLMMLVGLWDDLRPLSARVKIVSQIAIATLAWAVGFRILGWWSYDGGGLELGILSLPITVLWIVGVTNAFNLIDGLDGLGAGTTLFATMALFLAAMMTGQPDSMIVLAALAGAAVGFLRYNFSPATIFLGDSGSLMLGCLLALLSIQTSQKSVTAVAVAVPLLALGLPMIDMVIVVMRRIIGGQPIFAADRRHIHHALIERGLTPRMAVAVLYGVAGVFGMTSLLFLNPRGPSLGLAVAALASCAVIGMQQLRMPELRDLNLHLLRTVRHRRALMSAGGALHQAIAQFRVAESTAEVCVALAAALEETPFVRAVLLVHRQDETWPSGAGRGRTWRWTRSDAETARGEWTIAMPIRDGRLVLSYEPNGTYPAALVCWFGEDVTAELDRALWRVQRTGRRRFTAPSRQETAPSLRAGVTAH